MPPRLRGVLPVADELFGPWDRTGPPHNMPKRQAELVRAFRAVGHVLTAEIVGLAHDIIRELAERDETGKGWVVCKCPHLMFTPKDFNTWFGATSAQGIEHHQSHLIRNPLRRANSCYARGWGAHGSTTPTNSASTARSFTGGTTPRPSSASRTCAPLHTTSSKRSTPAGVCPRTDEEIDRACSYLAEQYHDSSAEKRTVASGFTPKSESGWAAPAELLDVYLADDEIHNFMHEQGWPVNRRAYEGWLPRRLVRAYTGATAGVNR